MTRPLVSIVITTKNEEHNIENCLLSIKEQTYSNIEIILVDNNSNDKNIYGPRIQYNQHTIWGATAIITYQLLDAIATATATDVSIYNFHEMLEN